MAAVETLTTLSLESKTYYDKVLLQRALPNLVHGQWAQKRNIPASGGKSIEFRKFSSLSAATTALTEGTAPSGSSLAMTSATATISQYGEQSRRSKIVSEYRESLNMEAPCMITRRKRFCTHTLRVS